MLGEGCTRRYDPDALSAECGTEFAEAAGLWRQLQSAPDQVDVLTAESEKKPR